MTTKVCLYCKTGNTDLSLTSVVADLAGIDCDCDTPWTVSFNFRPASISPAGVKIPHVAFISILKRVN